MVAVLTCCAQIFLWDLWGSWSSLRSWRFAPRLSAARVRLVLQMRRDWRGAVLPVGSGSGADLPLWKRKVIVLVALGLALVVQLYGVGPSSWVWGEMSLHAALRLGAEPLPGVPDRARWT